MTTLTPLQRSYHSDVACRPLASLNEVSPPPSGWTVTTYHKLWVLSKKDVSLSAICLQKFDTNKCADKSWMRIVQRGWMRKLCAALPRNETALQSLVSAADFRLKQWHKNFISILILTCMQDIFFIDSLSLEINVLPILKNLSVMVTAWVQFSIVKFRATHWRRPSPSFRGDIR